MEAGIRLVEPEGIFADEDQVDFPHDDLRFKGCLSLSRSLSTKFSYTVSENDFTSFSSGSVEISASGVSVTGLRIRGTLRVDSRVTDVTLADSVIFGSLRVGSACRNIRLVNCKVMNPAGAAIQVDSGTDITLDECKLWGSLVGVSVSNDVPFFPLHGTPDILANKCMIRDCDLSQNSVDVVLSVRLRPTDQSCTTASFSLSAMLEVSGIPNESVPKFEISVGGLLDCPLSFREWPVPLHLFNSLVAPRRGFKSNRRYCRFSLDGETITVLEDPAVAQTNTKKRPRTVPQKHSDMRVNLCGSLGVDTDCTPRDVESAFRRLALLYHPDKSLDGGAEFIRLKAARDKLLKLLVTPS